MPKFVTIGYGDQVGYDATPLEVRNAADAHDEVLRQQGAPMGNASSPIQVRNWDCANVQVEDKAFMVSALPIAGFAIVEAANIEEAISLVSKTPCAVSSGVVEIWPLNGA
jgi:hypothetical protein